jgi:acyl-CoA thioesterase FadM
MMPYQQRLSLNDRMIMHGELERIGEKSLVVYFKIMPQLSHVVTAENYVKPQNIWCPVCDTSQIQVNVV